MSHKRPSGAQRRKQQRERENASAALESARPALDAVPADVAATANVATPVNAAMPENAAVVEHGRDDTQSMKAQILANAPYAFPSLSKQYHESDLLSVAGEFSVTVKPTFEVLIKTDAGDGGRGGMFRAVLVTGPVGEALKIAGGRPKTTLNEAVKSLLRVTAKILDTTSPRWESAPREVRDGTVAGSFL